jgi:hypothetical protein
MTTWRELEAQGVKRCCAYFVGGRRCRRRAAEEFMCDPGPSGGYWCRKCGPAIGRATAQALKAMKVQTLADSTMEQDDD